ncbi:MAG: sulfatase-like hydrolase/transferase [candidate division KSB1 bacterium]|nr:sulfatase-like hydrolase/transferase [candidate division KSB1 bacterium]
MPKDAGFDEHCLWQVQHKGSRYWDPTIIENGVLHEKLQGEFGPDVFTDYITDFITRHQSDPFFVYYPMALTHNPFVPTPQQNPTDTEKNSDDPSHFKYFVEYTDSLVGRIVETLDRLNLRENTLIVFTGDNGTKNTVTSRMPDKSIRGDKGNPTVYGTHVPLVINWHNVIAPNQVNENLIDFTDFFVTFAEAAGIEPPADLPLDGLSFLPQLLGKPCETREWVFCHYEPRWSRWKPARFVHNKTWKLYGDGRIFNIKNDPLEENHKNYEDLDTATKRTIDTFKNVLKTMKGAK